MNEWIHRRCVQELGFSMNLSLSITVTVTVCRMYYFGFVWLSVHSLLLLTVTTEIKKVIITGKKTLSTRSQPSPRMCKVFVLASGVRLAKKILQKASHRLQLYFSSYTVVHVHIHWEFWNGVSHKGKMYMHVMMATTNKLKRIQTKASHTKQSQSNPNCACTMSRTTLERKKIKETNHCSLPLLPRFHVFVLDGMK